MPSLTPAVRVAASSIVLLSLAHIIFWAMLAITLRPELPHEFPYNYFFPILCLFSAAGIPGIFVGGGLFYARNWARIAAIALGAIAGFFCALGMLLPLLILFAVVPLAGLGVDLPVASKSDFLRLFFVYFFIFGVSLWWIFIFSRKNVIAQFTANAISIEPAAPKRAVCPPPIALLAWLMIASGALSAVSWPLIFGKIPAMLFNHIFSTQASQWIWAINTLLFLACGAGLLKLQRWSYTGTIALHAFWLVSLFVTQLSPLYNRYVALCLSALVASDSYVSLGLERFPQWVAALLSALPTALLIAGLFYYRSAFLKAVAESKR